MRTLVLLLAVIGACYGQVTVKYSIQPSGVFRALAGRQLPARTALYEAVACADADSLIDEGRLLHAAPFVTVSQVAPLTLQASRSRAAMFWRILSIAAPLAFAGLGIADVNLEILAPVGGATALISLVNQERNSREAVPNVGAWVGSDILMLGAGRCVTRLLLGDYPPRVPMPARVTLSTVKDSLTVQPSSQGRNSSGSEDMPAALDPIAAGSPATFEIPIAWRHQ